MYARILAKPTSTAIMRPKIAKSGMERILSLFLTSNGRKSIRALKFWSATTRIRIDPAIKMNDKVMTMIDKGLVMTDA